MVPEVFMESGLDSRAFKVWLLGCKHILFLWYLQIVIVVAYMAPEVFTKSNSDGHGRAVDVWSLGCVVVEMASGKVSKL